MVQNISPKSEYAIVITGVSSGIGAAVAQHMLSEGYTVFGSVRKIADAEPLQTAYAEAFEPLVFDTTDSPSIHASVNHVQSIVKQKNQRLIALINNAGVAVFGPMECLSNHEFEHAIAVNLFGTRNVTNAFLPLLRQSGAYFLEKNKRRAGVIINISSLSGILNTPMNGAYCVSKHGMESIGEIYRRELYASGIDVCSIRSGPIQSEIWNKNINDQIEYENADYALMSKNAQGIMQSGAEKALPALVIAKLVQDIVERRKRRVAYEVGSGSRIAKILSSSVVPARIVDRLIARALLKPRA